MKDKLSYLAPLITGVCILFIPLVRDFHLESAILAATTGAFWAGVACARQNGGIHSDSIRCVRILGYLYLAGLPLLIYALITGCYTIQGFGFWIFLPGPSVFFGGGIGRLVRSFNIPWPSTCTIVTLLLIALGGLLYEFLTLPQLYFFNHVWGYWPGPIYDEAVRFPLSLVGFRFLTFCWILIVWLVPSLNQETLHRWLFGLAAAALMAGYTQLEDMRIVSPNSYLQQQLGGLKQTEETRIYYASSSYSDEEIDRLSKEIAFHTDQIKQTLALEKPDSTTRFEIYLYADPWQKKKLVGAKYTSYVTVWQSVPQIHIAKEQVSGSLKHEIIHAVTALLEWPGLLPNIGLTEGIAVALDPDRSPKSTIDQLVAAQEPYPTVEQMQSYLSYWGFYTGRSSVNYTTVGSFVRYLIESHPPKYFVQAYRCGDVAQAYPQPFPKLVDGWHQRLDSVHIDSSDRNRASEIFGRLSIFEQQCPHKVPRSVELYDQFLLSSSRNDTSGAIAALSELKEIDPEQYNPTLLWMLWNLKARQPKLVIDEPVQDQERIEAHLLSADAYRMDGQPQQARESLYKAIALADQQADTTLDEAIAVRLDSLQWNLDLRVRYRNALLDSTEFKQAYYRTKIRTLKNALASDSVAVHLTMYARKLAELPQDMDHFDTYLSIIHRLVHTRNFTEADKWIEKLSSQKLSLRLREQLQQQKEWLEYNRVQ